MGHREAFDKYGYDQTAKDEDDILKNYLRAQPFLNILTETKPFKLVHEDEVTRLQRELDEAKKKLSEREKDFDDRIKEVERFMRSFGKEDDFEGVEVDPKKIRAGG
jgi:3-deoxy-D-arabino-heptulosonate 7-phosphate (DAHP) synthase class II